MTAATPKTITPAAPAWKQPRGVIAIVVLVLSILGVVYLAGTMISHSTAKDEAARYILASVLPLLGTWVGTVLAFYFSRDNFEAATRSTKELLGIDQKLATIPVTDVMLPYTDLLRVEEDDDSKIVLNEWLKKMETANKGQRLPVFSSKNVARYVIHKSVITDYLSAEAIKGVAKAALEKLTLANLIANRKELKSVIESFGGVKKSASLDKVKAMMEQSNDIQDVFVTKNGKRDGEVLGWITNVIIDEHSTV